MMGFLFFLVTIFILILSFQHLRKLLILLTLKKKIKNNPLIGIRQQDDIYDCKEKGYTISYRIEESPTGVKNVEWVSLKYRLTFLEKNILHIKRELHNFFVYQKWIVLLRPPLVIVLVISLVIFYFGIQEYSFKRMERFKWVVARITGINPESIRYAPGGWFKVAGQRLFKDREVDSVTISFNPLSWLFFSDTAEVKLWNTKLNKYCNYGVAFNNKDDIWLKNSGQIHHGRLSGEGIVWDKPVGSTKISGQAVSVKDSKLQFIDE